MAGLLCFNNLLPIFIDLGQVVGWPVLVLGHLITIFGTFIGATLASLFRPEAFGLSMGIALTLAWSILISPYGLLDPVPSLILLSMLFAGATGSGWVLASRNGKKASLLMTSIFGSFMLTCAIDCDLGSLEAIIRMQMDVFKQRRDGEKLSYGIWTFILWAILAFAAFGFQRDRTDGFLRCSQMMACLFSRNPQHVYTTVSGKHRGFMSVQYTILSPSTYLSCLVIIPQWERKRKPQRPLLCNT